jgi:hypothetical protein
MSVSIGELTARTEWVMQRNVRMLREDGHQSADFYFGRGSGSLLYNVRLTVLADWMNSGEMKERLFALIRVLIEEVGYDCFIFASDTWSFEGNKAFRQLPDARAQELLAKSSIPELVELGYGTSVEAIIVMGQTAKLACVSKTTYYRDPVNPDKIARVGKTQTGEGDIETFAGRAKMFGTMKDGGTRRAYKKIHAQRREIKEVLAQMANLTSLVNIATEEP